MAKGNRIIVSDDPRGRMFSGYIYGTPKPGTVMMLKPGVEPINGRHTWQVYDRAADGSKGTVVVLLEDDDQGKTKDDAYVSGTVGKLYCPIAGEELNMLVGDVAGTGGTSDFAIGDRLMIDDGTGKVVDIIGTPDMASFELLETITDLAGDAHAWVMYSGH